MVYGIDFNFNLLCIEYNPWYLLLCDGDNLVLRLNTHGSTSDN